MLLLSKLLNLLAQPLNGVLLLLVLAVLRGWRNPRKGRWWSATALLLLALLGVKTLPDLLVAPLENQYPEIPANADLSRYVGVIILGGALEPGRLSEAHQQALLNASGERMTEAVALWRRHPTLRLVFTGGEGELFGSGPSEAERATRFFASMGVPAAALTLEGRSQNTYENAVFTARLPGLDTKQPWLLLTSAWHMPRSMAVFQKAGWNVTAYPVDYRTGGITPLSSYNLGEGAERWELLLHEWIGIAAYRISGRS
ncbi:MAG: YdcF family protein [Rhodoferax sp.]|nr:YdcF family protein [Rhodoferax sp.]